MRTTNLSLALCACALSPFLAAQDKSAPAEAKPPAKAASVEVKNSVDRYRDTDLDPYRAFTLKPSSGPNDDNEILTGLRLMLSPSTKLYLVPTDHLIMIRGTPDNIALAEKLLADMDKVRRVYKLTYTVTESDGGKRVGVQHFTLTIVNNGRTTLKNGSKVPVVTGGTDKTPEFQYLDIGMNFDATIDDFASGVRLRSKVEQSSATEEKTVGGVQEPLIRQSVLEGTTLMTIGRPLMLGSLDIAGSTRHLDIEAIVELTN